MQPTISILIAAHGDEPHLVDSVKSALAQNYPDLTVVLSVTQQVPATVTDLAADHRLTIVTAPSTAAPYHAALQAATGEYIYFLSAGDHFYQPDSLAEVSSLAQEAKADLLIANVIRLENHVLYFPGGKRTAQRVLTRNNFPLWFRLSTAVRTLSGDLIQRSLLSQALATAQPRVSDQLLIQHLVKLADHPIESKHLAVVWRHSATHRLPNLNWDEVPPLSPLRQLLPAPTSRATRPVPERISLALGIDQGVEAHLAPLLYSIGQTNSAPIDVYIVATELSADTQAKLAWLNDHFANLRIMHTPLPPADYEMIRQLADFGHQGPLSVYYRVFLPQLLPHLDRVIYLDADTLVTGDLSALWHSDLHGNLLGCVRDDGSGVTPPPKDPTDWWAYHILGPAGKDYFNSGMLVFDLHQWRQYSLGLYFYEFLRDTVNLYLLEDQDALNFFCQGAVTYLSPAVNCVTKALARTPRSLDQTTILHFLGPQKPWKMTFHQPRVQWPAIAHYRQVARAWTQAYQPTLPLISVLLDTAHDETYLLEQLESLLCQSYGQLEVIIVTAADVPAADSPLAQLLALNANLHLVAQAGSTTAHRWQTGLAAAHGAFIFLLGPTDRLTEPTIIAQMAALQREADADLVSGYRLTYIPARNALRGTANSGRHQDLSHFTLPQLLPVGIGEYHFAPGHLIRRQAFKYVNWDAPLIPQLLVQTPKKIHWEQNTWFHREIDGE